MTTKSNTRKQQLGKTQEHNIQNNTLHPETLMNEMISHPLH